MIRSAETVLKGLGYVLCLVAWSGCAPLGDSYGSDPSYYGSRSPSPYDSDPWYTSDPYSYRRDPYYRHEPYHRDRVQDVRRERERLEEERERLEEERHRLERERNRGSKPTHPHHAAPERCPPGFSYSDEKCRGDERKRGCKDIRMPSGRLCVHR